MKTVAKQKRGKLVIQHVGLRGLKRDLAAFEKKYGMTTQVFLEKVGQGELAESNDFIDWLGLAEIFQRLSNNKAK